MKTFLLSLLIIFSPLSSPLSFAKDAEGKIIEIKEQNFLEIQTPSMKNRKTAKIQLENGLEAYLISDPDVEKSGASLTMGVGQWSDPKEYPGMAHFLEHMLFMGTKAYPGEAEFEKTVSDNGGVYNAFTAFDRTAYFFSVNHEAFLIALDKFSHFFIDPLLNPSAIQRELLAVDQENDKNIENDSQREWMVLKETGNQSHPNARFSTGNAKTLGKIPQEALYKWYEKHYSADKAHLILCSPLSIEELKKLAFTYFSPVKKKETKDSLKYDRITSPSQQGHLLTITPVKEIRSLQLIWELPKEIGADLDDKSSDLIARVLSSKHPAGLYQKLKGEELVEDVEVSTFKVGTENLLFMVSFDLTKQGVTQKERVITISFQMLQVLKEKGIPSYVFQEIQKMSKIGYEYQSRGDTFSTLSDYAFSIADEPLATYPLKGIYPISATPEKTKKVLDLLTPETAIYLLSASPELTKAIANHKEKWTGAEYAITKLSEGQLSSWHDLPSDPHFALPLENPFVPSQLKLSYKGEEKEEIPTPELLSDDPYGKIYYWKDERYLVPEISWTLSFKSPLIDGTAENRVLLDLFKEALSESLASLVFYAQGALLNPSLFQNDLALTIQIDGLSEKALLLLKGILQGAKTTHSSQEQFNLYKTCLESRYLSMKKNMPIQQALEIYKDLFFNTSPRSQEKLSALKEITYEGFLSYIKNLFQTGYVEALFAGNITKEEVHQIWEATKNSLMFSPYLKNEQIKKQILILPEHEGPFKIHERIESQGNVGLLVLEEGPFSFKRFPSTAILGQALADEFFNTLRTKQQTGYIAKSSSFDSEGEFLKLFLVQSTTHYPEELSARFELFLENYVKDFEEQLPEGRFENIRKNLLTTLLIPPPNLSAMASQLYELAFTHEGDFTRIQKKVAATKKLTYEEFKEDSIRSLSRQNKKRLAILLQGAPAGDKSFFYKSISAKTMKEIGTYTSTK